MHCPSDTVTKAVTVSERRGTSRPDSNNCDKCVPNCSLIYQRDTKGHNWKFCKKNHTRAEPQPGDFETSFSLAWLLENFLLWARYNKQRLEFDSTHRFCFQISVLYELWLKRNAVEKVRMKCGRLELINIRWNRERMDDKFWISSIRSKTLMDEIQNARLSRTAATSRLRAIEISFRFFVSIRGFFFAYFCWIAFC